MIIGFILAGSLPSSGSGKGLRTPKNWFVKPRHWSPRTITHFLSARLPACTATELKGTYRCIMCGVRLLLFYVCCTNLGLVWLPYACSVLCFSTASRRNSVILTVSLTWIEEKMSSSSNLCIRVEETVATNWKGNIHCGGQVRIAGDS